MKPTKIFQGLIPTMHNTPCCIAVFADSKGKIAKAYQKEFYRNAPGLGKWHGNVNFERLTLAQAEQKFSLLGMVEGSILPSIPFKA